MRSYAAMLDTNIVSHLMRNPAGPVRQRLISLNARTCVSIISACELRYRARKVNSRVLDRQIDEILEVIETLPLEEDVVEVYASIRSHLAVAGKPIGPTDTFIAAHALALDMTLITANVREFSRVPGLRVENWLD